MIYRDQLITKHDPPYQWGDCERTAIGCLLDIPPQDVPHFCDGLGDWKTQEQAHLQIQMWLAKFNLFMANAGIPGDLNFKEAMELGSDWSRGHRWLMGGESESGALHVVVVLNGELDWDPHPRGTGLTHPIYQPDDDCYLWVYNALALRV